MDVQRGWAVLPGRGSAGNQICHPPSLCAATREARTGLRGTLHQGTRCRSVCSGASPRTRQKVGREDSGIPWYGVCVGPGRAWGHDRAPYIRERALPKLGEHRRDPVLHTPLGRGVYRNHPAWQSWGGGQCQGAPERGCPPACPRQGALHGLNNNSPKPTAFLPLTMHTLELWTGQRPLSSP